MTDIGQPRSYDGHLIDGLVELTHRTEQRQREQANAHEWLSEAGFVLSEDDWAAEHAQWVYVPVVVAAEEKPNAGGVLLALLALAGLCALGFEVVVQLGRYLDGWEVLR